MEKIYGFDILKQIILFMTPSKLFQTSQYYDSIKKDDKFWIYNIKKRFGYYKKIPHTIPLNQYYLMSFNQNKLDFRIRKWLEYTDSWLDLSNLNLYKWPKELIGKEHLIKRLKIDNNHFLRLPALKECEELIAYNNKLLILPHLPKCKRLLVMDNKLTSIKNLASCEYLDCSDNKIELVYECPKLEIFFCYYLEKSLSRITLMGSPKPEYGSHKISNVQYSYQEYIENIILSY